MTGFADSQKDFEASFEELTVRELAIAQYFWDEATLAANPAGVARAGDAANEEEKSTRKEKHTTIEVEPI